MANSLLQSVVGIINWGNFIAKWDNITEKASHLRDTRRNRDPGLLKGQMCLENGGF